MALAAPRLQGSALHPPHTALHRDPSHTPDASAAAGERSASPGGSGGVATASLPGNLRLRDLLCTDDVSFGGPSGSIRLERLSAHAGDTSARATQSRFHTPYSMREFVTIRLQQGRMLVYAAGAGPAGDLAATAAPPAPPLLLQFPLSNVLRIAVASQGLRCYGKHGIEASFSIMSPQKLFVIAQFLRAGSGGALCVLEDPSLALELGWKSARGPTRMVAVDEDEAATGGGGPPTPRVPPAASPAAQPARGVAPISSSAPPVVAGPGAVAGRISDRETRRRGIIAQLAALDGNQEGSVPPR